MTLRPFGSTGVNVARIGQGTFLMEHADRSAAVRAIRHGLDLGLSHIDTAEMYGEGEVERVVSEATAGRRDEVFLVSKVLPSNASRSGTVRACEASLKRLGTDHLDAFLLHWPGSHPLEDTIAAFEELVQAGKIRSYGVSNFDEVELARAVALSGPGRIACNQVLYHLGERTNEHRVIPACEAHGVAVVAYTPFGRATFPPATGAETLSRIARERGTTAHALALAFLTRKNAVFAIPKASAPQHQAANAEAMRLALTDDEILALEAAFPIAPRRCGVARI